MKINMICPKCCGKLAEYLGAEEVTLVPDGTTLTFECLQCGITADIDFVFRENDYYDPCGCVSTVEPTGGIIKTEPFPFNMTFQDASKEGNSIIGELFEKDGVLHFEGNADESALVFLDAVIKLWR